MIRLLYFGKLAEFAGGRCQEVEVPNDVDTIASLIDWIGNEDAKLADFLRASTVRIAVDQEICGGEHKITNANEIAFMPPMSGG